MRVFTLSLAVFILSGLAAAAATVTLTKSLSYRTTDWTPYVNPHPADPGKVLLIGSEIFEEYLGPDDKERYGVPQLDPRLGPADWVHISHVLTMEIISTGRQGSGGGFTLSLGNNDLASGSYGPSDGIWTSGRIRSVGTVPVSPTLFEGLSANTLFTVRGGAVSYLALNIPHADLADNHPDMRTQEQSRLDGTLFGRITLTAGYDGAPEPLFSPAFVQVSAVPLPASGLLLGAVVAGGAARARRR